MIDQSPLIVPIRVEALVVNDAVRQGPNPFVRTQMQYQRLANASTAEPTASDSDPNFGSPGVVGDLPASLYYNGIYLKWRLPDALVHGIQQANAAPDSSKGGSGANGDTLYPALPNRWLVFRTDGHAGTKSWIVESDYIAPANAPRAQNASQLGSLYLQPPSRSGRAPSVIRIGRNIDLDSQSWSETGSSLGLTAIAPGNPAFAVYQPDCNNVFSLIDVLASQPDEVYSYLLIGWYGTASEDELRKLLAGNLSFDQALSALNWGVAAGTDPALQASSTLFVGSTSGVFWRGGTTPIAGGPPSTPVSIAVGNTSVEALTALVTGQASENSSVRPDLFEAFQLDLIRALDDPDAGALLTEGVHDSGFQFTEGGYAWEIVDAPNSSATLSQAESDAEAAVLAALVVSQTELDAARRLLAGLRQRLYQLWWKYVTVTFGRPPRGFDVPAIVRQLNPAVAGSLAAQVQAQIDRVSSLIAAGNVPSGDTQEALQDAIERFARQKGLSPNRLLKRTSLNRFALPNNLVVLFSGVGSGGLDADQGRLPVRFPSQVVTLVKIDGKEVSAATPALKILTPPPDRISRALPGSALLIQKVVTEFFLLNPQNAASIASAIGSTPDAVRKAQGSQDAVDGVLPFDSGVWLQNPWRPQFLFWSAKYYPIEYGTREQPNWLFEDDEFRWTGAGAEAQPLSLTGRILLSSHAALNVQRRIEQFLADAPDLDPNEQRAFNELLVQVRGKGGGNAQGWDLLSQALNGFNDQLESALTGAAVSPSLRFPELSPSIAELIGPEVGPPLSLGADHFQPWRSGQLYFDELLVVDQWGQTRSVINEKTFQQVTIARPPDLTPQIPILKNLAVSFVQTPPRFLQPARLDFDLIDVTDPNQVYGIMPQANPVVGWVLPNHLDRGLLAYSAAGDLLGELSMNISAADRQEVCWTGAPDGPYQTLAALRAGVPFLGAFFEGVARQGPAVFTALLAAIDQTLWSTIPMAASFDTDLTTLVGRPLAVLRARVRFALNGPPVSDPAFKYTFKPATPAFTGYYQPIELGKVGRLEDGLIGYFLDGDDFNRFNVVHPSTEAAPDYLKAIGVDGNYVYLPFDGQTVASLTLLADARALIHATTGVVPSRAVGLAPALVTAALSKIAVTFRVGPILTDSVSTAAGEHPATSLHMPLPSLRGATWSWVEQEGEHFVAYPALPSDGLSNLSNVPPVLRRGYLRLAEGEFG